MTFRYFQGPDADMAFLLGVGRCCLCGHTEQVLDLDIATCPELLEDAKPGQAGCFRCLRTGRFEFWHDTDIGLLDENGLTHVYNHNQPPPVDFHTDALIELRRTPQIATCQQEIWLTHCRDFMAYLGTWEPPDFYARAPDGDGRSLFLRMTDLPYDPKLWDAALEPGSQRLERWGVTYYAFRCLHCETLKGNWDCD